jgi:hypothetical protein
MSEPLTIPPPVRNWDMAAILAYCQRTGRDPALFLDPAPPPNPPMGVVERMAQAAVADVVRALPSHRALPALEHPDDGHE